MHKVKLVEGDYTEHVAAEKLTNEGEPFTKIEQLFGAARAIVDFALTQKQPQDRRQLRAAVSQYEYKSVHTALMYLVRRKFLSLNALLYSLGPLTQNNVDSHR